MFATGRSMYFGIGEQTLVRSSRQRDEVANRTTQKTYLSLNPWLSPLLGLIVAIPLLPIIGILYLLVRLTSKGPGFYSQVRLGLNGKRYTIYKLRTMVVDAEATTGPVWATKDDPR